jgi:hypothetical protein
MSISNSQVSINSLSQEDREKLKAAINGIDGSLTRVAAERDYVKNVINDVSDQIGLDKKTIRRLAKTFHKASFKMDKEEQETFEEIYTEIFGGE